jgi:hypothetical protein
MEAFEHLMPLVDKALQEDPSEVVHTINMMLRKANEHVPQHVEKISNQLSMLLDMLSAEELARHHIGVYTIMKEVHADDRIRNELEHKLIKRFKELDKSHPVQAFSSYCRNLSIDCSSDNYCSSALQNMDNMLSKALANNFDLVIEHMRSFGEALRGSEAPREEVLNHLR